MKFVIKHGVPLLIGFVGIALFSFYMFDVWGDFYSYSECVTKDAVARLFAEDFRFWSLPHLIWNSEKFLYPYGIDLTFMAWALELFSFEALARNLFGCYFPIHWYYLFSLAVTYFGTYMLVGRRKGAAWGTFFAFAFTFCNYAAICKFPVHFMQAVVHWMILNVIWDAEAIDRYFSGEKFSARFVLVKIVLLLLCLGLELGYIAGVAYCCSFVMFCYFLLAQVVRERSIFGPMRWIIDAIFYFIATYRRSSWNYFLTGGALFLAWLYLPQISQIFFAAPPSSGGACIWRTDPIRALIPILPSFNPLTYMNQSTSNVIFAWNAGWTFLAAFLLGICSNFRRDWMRWLPFVVYFLLLVFFWSVPVLRFFPTFRYARNSEQFSSFVIVAFLIPVYFASAPVCLSHVKSQIQKAGCLVLMAPLFVVELYTAYSHCFAWRRNFPLQEFPTAYKAAVQLVKDLPGEAIFFMPFSAHGGDGNGMTKYHYLTAHQMQFAARAEKKMNGVYLGRMVPDRYLSDFKNFDWPYYIGSKVWSERRWKTLEKFFKNSDFAAMVLDVSKLTADQRDDIIGHMGNPVAAFDIFGDKYEVIPMPDKYRGVKNAEVVRGLVCEPEPLDANPVLFSKPDERVVLQNGFAGAEPWGVWSTAPSFSLRVTIPKLTQDAVLNICAQAYKKVTAVRVFFNDEPVAEWNVPDGRKREYAVHIPQRFSDCTGLLRFEQTEIASPHELNPKDRDIRKLGMGLISISLQKQE